MGGQIYLIENIRGRIQDYFKTNTSVLV